MQTDLPSGAHYGRTGRLYVWGPSRSKRKRRNRLDLCGSPPPVTPAQARLPVGRALRGHGAPLAASGQKHRWPPWFGLGYGVVCALGGVAAGEEPQLTRHGVVSGRECRGTGVHGAPGRSQAADPGPFQHCPGVCGPWQRRCGRDQCADPPCRQGLWLCRPQYPVVGYHRAGVAHWVSQRTRDLAGVGSALWPRPCKAQNVWGVDHALAQVQTILRSVKEHHLFAKGKQEKRQVLTRLLTEVGQLVVHTRPLVTRLVQSRDRVTQRATATFVAMHAVAKRLIPQIVQWITTGVVAQGKIIHAGLTQARAIVRNKAGKQVEFGLPYLLSRLGGG